MPRGGNIGKAQEAWTPKMVEPHVSVRAEELHRAARRLLLKEES